MATKEQVQQARQADLVEYLRAKGIKLKKAGQDWRLPGHGGLLIQKNMYWYASTGSGGNSLDFLVEIEGVSFLEAVRELTEGNFSSRKAFQEEKKEPTAVTPATDSLPSRAANERRVIAYLTKTRKIPAPLIFKCIKKKIIYQDIQGNAVFVCQPAGAMVEGTLSEVRFKKRIGSGIWVLPGTSQSLAIVESPIDALSLATLKPEIGTILALGGTSSERTLFAFLNDFQPKKIYLGLDNDTAGQNANLRLSEKIPNTEILKPENKDWNEDLIVRWLN